VVFGQTSKLYLLSFKGFCEGAVGVVGLAVCSFSDQVFLNHFQVSAPDNATVAWVHTSAFAHCYLQAASLWEGDSVFTTAPLAQTSFTVLSEKVFSGCFNSRLQRN
jgi:hypothetical protein